MTAVNLVQLTRYFGHVKAVEQLDLAINPGELVALLGPSGCGKTTTMRMIAGLLAPSAGDVQFDGKSMLKVPAEQRGAVMVFQKHLLFPTMDVAQNIGFGLKMQGVKPVEIRQRVGEMLELVRLPGFERRRAHELSGGQQQRIALARALVIQPRVLLLDEPLANLDANLRLEMRALIRKLQRELKITTLFVTHDQEEAVMLADRVALIFDGALQQYAAPQAFYERPRTAQVARFFRNDNFLLGVKRQNQVETALGCLEVDLEQVNQPDGPVLLSVRPEEIQLHPTATDNLLYVPVLSSVYMGVYTQVQLQVNGQPWLAHGPANLHLPVGAQIAIRLPAARIWLLPVT